MIVLILCVGVRGLLFVFLLCAVRELMLSVVCGCLLVCCMLVVVCCVLLVVCWSLLFGVICCMLSIVC